MRRFGNDRWQAETSLAQVGRYFYTIVAWRDLFSTWRDEVIKKRDAGQAVSLEVEEGVASSRPLSPWPSEHEASALRRFLEHFEGFEHEPDRRASPPRGSG